MAEYGALDYLTEMRNISEVSVDLAYSALLLNDKGLAKDVIELEKKMNDLKLALQSKVVVTRMPPKSAKDMVAMLEIANATEKISNAAHLIATLVLKGIGSHPFFKNIISKKTFIFKRDIKRSGLLVGKKISEVNLTELAGMKLVAIKKKDEWLVSPSPELIIEKGDTFLLSGPPEKEDLLDKIFK